MSNCKIYQKKKKKKTLNFWLKMPYLGIFGREFWKAIFIFEINTIKFVKLQNFAKKQKWLNMGLKMPYLVIVGQ